MPVFQNAVTLEIKDHVALLTLNRPKSLNAISRGLVVGLKEAAEYIDTTPDIRVVILTGSGDRAFCAGLDLKMMAIPGEEHPGWLEHANDA